MVVFLIRARGPVLFPRVRQRLAVTRLRAGLLLAERLSQWVRLEAAATFLANPTVDPSRAG